MWDRESLDNHIFTKYMVSYYHLDVLCINARKFVRKINNYRNYIIVIINFSKALFPHTETWLQDLPFFYNIWSWYNWQILYIQYSEFYFRKNNFTLYVYDIIIYQNQWNQMQKFSFLFSINSYFILQTEKFYWLRDRWIRK